MLVDLHAHTRGISTCCRIHAPEVIDAAKAAGLDGIVLTNHYQKSYIKDDDFAGFAARYVAEYRHVAEIGRAAGLTVLFGIEVTMAQHGNVHMLIYGVGEDFPLRHPALFDYTQEELYRLVRDSGGVLVQAHPMRRNKNVLLDPRFLDGVEISCHPLYEGTHYDELAAYAADHGLILTCGGDYHADTPRPHCGVYLPDGMESKKLGQYLKTVPRIKLFVHEIGEIDAHDVLFERRTAAAQ